MGSTIQSRRRIDATTYVGPGKAARIKEECERLAANLVVFDNDLSPAQSRNLEKVLALNVIDRTELILDIFSRRAKTKQASIQVEIAQLTYALPRLTRLWEHLSRQAGGIGTRGPGETQLEVDRRRVRERIAALRKRLEHVARTRKLHRDSRAQVPYPTVALVG